MREIKYKVITKSGKILCYEWFDGDGWKNDYYAPLVSNGIFNYEELGDGFIEDIIRLQYIGLKDKNGKEIYDRQELFQKITCNGSREMTEERFIQAMCKVQTNINGQ